MPARGPLRPIARRALAAQSDERLVKLIREGHEPAFEEAVRRYRGPLVAFAAAIVSADRAEDVVQSSLMKALDALRRDDREISLRPWLFAIVRNGALNEIRGEAPVDELREAGALAAGPGEIAERREEMDRLVVAMCALPDAQRQALVKRELEGVGHGEIAAQLGTTATAVRGLIFRARVGLRDALGALLPLPVMRALLAEGTAAGLAGGGAAAGIVGGSAAKGGAAAAAAIVALGTGVAIDRSTRDEPGSQRPEVARAQAPDRPSGQPSATEPGTRPDADEAVRRARAGAPAHRRRPGTQATAGPPRPRDRARAEATKATTTEGRPPAVPAPTTATAARANRRRHLSRATTETMTATTTATTPAPAARADRARPQGPARAPARDRAPAPAQARTPGPAPARSPSRSRNPRSTTAPGPAATAGPAAARSSRPTTTP